jgi:hypothetical protein
LQEEQDEEINNLSTASSHLCVLTARGVRPTTTTAADAHSHPTYVDSGTCDSDAGAAYANARPPHTHVDPNTSNADAGTPYTNTHPSDTHADGRAPHGYAGAADPNTCSADTNVRARGVDGTARRPQPLRNAFLFHRSRLHV